ncbi:MAG: PHP domain-containing protein, partial [Phycisphaerae bacterium]|nr:PHP domain-containing protein [Phycisphaerae bacterium]
MKTHLTPLHVRSGYSLLTGVAPPQRLIRRAKALGYTEMALTDINNLCAATFFYRQAEQASVRPILGAELRQEPHTAVALVAEHTGYENLCRIITRIHRTDRPDAEKPTLIDNLTELGEGLHVIVEDAHLGRALLAGGAKAKRLWVGLDPATQSHRQVRRLIEWAEKANLPLVATGKAHLLDPEDLDTARLLAAIRTGSTYDDVDAKDLPHPGAILRSPAELREQLAAFGRAVVNNQRLAEQCRYKLLDRDPVFPHFQPPEGLSAQKFLRRLCRNAMRHRYGDTPPIGAENRLEKELNLIGRLGF